MRRASSMVVPDFRTGIVLVAAAIGMCAAAPAHAVTVSPTALYIDHETRSATLTLRNTSANAVEVTLDFVFGYPVNDPAGRVHVPLYEVAPEGEPSAAAWLRSFPRQIRLEPGERQVVRILASPPSDLADGEYWARAIVTVRGALPPIEEEIEGRAMRVDLETAMVLAATYRKGALSTGVRVRDAEAHFTNEEAVLALEMERVGTAAFLGRIVGTLIDPQGSEVASGIQNVAVYRSLVRTLSIPLPEGYEVTPGHRIRYRLDTERSDLPQIGPIQADVVVGVATFDTAAAR